jgi:N-acetylneuraminic acid mutarotase
VSRLACCLLLDRTSANWDSEIKPREPVSSSVHCIDLKTGDYEEIEGRGEIPQARVGHTAATVNGEIYIFGGVRLLFAPVGLWLTIQRGGAAMTPLEESGAIYAFNPKTSTWRKLVPSYSSESIPQARSYHCSTASSDSVIIHAGCGNADVGRLNDLWSFNISTQVWTKLADAPGDSRGGSAIAFDQSTNRLWRFGGFNGKIEVGGVIDYIELANKNMQDAKWQSIEFGDTKVPGKGDDTELTKTTFPGARSVTGLHVLADGRLITFFGEGKPSPTGGHDAAGNFWGDVWTLDGKNGTWTEVEQQGETPGERGWFSSDVFGKGAIVWGGINSDNDRIPDGWVLKLDQ